MFESTELLALASLSSSSCCVRRVAARDYFSLLTSQRALSHEWRDASTRARHRVARIMRARSSSITGVHTMRPILRLATAIASIVSISSCGSPDATSATPGSGFLRVQLTDAPFPFDSVQSVDIFVVRVDARLSEADSSESARGASDDSAQVGGWTTIARPNRSFDLLTLRGGTVADIGRDTVPKGSYRGFRLIIDPSRSAVKLRNGMLLTGSSSPSVTFPSAARSGIKIVLAKAIDVGADSTSTMLIDFDLEGSFVMRGNSITKNGLIFKPVVHASAKISSP